MIEDIIRQFMDEAKTEKLFAKDAEREAVERLLRKVLDRTLGFMFKPPIPDDKPVPLSPFQHPYTGEPRRGPLDPRRAQ